MNIPGKFLVFIIRYVALVLLFIFFEFIARLYLHEDNILTAVVAIVPAVLLAPRVQIRQDEDHKTYGLKVLFYPKIIWFN